MVASTLCRTPVPVSIDRTAVPARTQQHLRKVVRRGIPFGAGEVNDPEKTRKRMEEKKNEVFGAKPKNKNPLEKTTIAHDVELGEGVEKAEGAVEGAIKKVGDKIKEVTGQD